MAVKIFYLLCSRYYILYKLVYFLLPPLKFIALVYSRVGTHILLPQSSRLGLNQNEEGMDISWMLLFPFVMGGNSVFQNWLEQKASKITTNFNWLGS